MSCDYADVTLELPSVAILQFDGVMDLWIVSMWQKLAAPRVKMLGCITIPMLFGVEEAVVLGNRPLK
jgi:hypothetical protein